MPGLLDPILSADTAAQFAACGKQLAAVDKNTEYGYLFETMQKLCALLAVKADIGKRTRSAYRQKDAARSARLSANTNRCRRWSTTSITRSAGSG